VKNGDWAEKIQHLQQRVEQLWQRAGQPLTLSEALEEVATTLGELSVVHEELRQQNEELLESRHTPEAEQQRYQELFEFAPDGYLVTDVEGVIREANHAATVLRNVPAFGLSGKPLALYVPNTDRSVLRSWRRLTRRYNRAKNAFSNLPNISTRSSGSPISPGNRCCM
jgi:two-component system cell cycle sensor histidine kinase/response regulator CckA